MSFVESWHRKPKRRVSYSFGCKTMMSLFVNPEDLDTCIHSEIGYSETNLSLSIIFTFIRLKLTARHNIAFVHQGERTGVHPLCLILFASLKAWAQLALKSNKLVPKIRTSHLPASCLQKSFNPQLTGKTKHVSLTAGTPSFSPMPTTHSPQLPCRQHSWGHRGRAHTSHMIGHSYLTVKLIRNTLIDVGSIQKYMHHVSKPLNPFFCQ